MEFQAGYEMTPQLHYLEFHTCYFQYPQYLESSHHYHTVTCQHHYFNAVATLPHAYDPWNLLKVILKTNVNNMQLMENDDDELTALYFPPYAAPSHIGT